MTTEQGRVPAPAIGTTASHRQTIAEQRLMPLGPPPKSSPEGFVNRANRQLALMTLDVRSLMLR